MSYNRRTGNLRSFIVRIILLTVLSLIGMMAGVTTLARPVWLQDSSVFKWVAAFLCAFVLADTLFWLPSVAPDGRMAPARRLDWSEIKSKGKGQYMQEVMALNLWRALYYQPLIILIGGWLLGWETGRVVGIISFFVFFAIFLSFFDVLRYWEVNEKREKKAVQN